MHLVCYAFLSITSAFRDFLRPAEGLHCRSDRRQIEKIPRTRLYFWRKPKPNAKSRNIRKSKWTRKPKDQSFFGTKTENRIFKIAKIVKTKASMPPRWLKNETYLDLSRLRPCRHFTTLLDTAVKGLHGVLGQKKTTTTKKKPATTTTTKQ